MTHHYGRLVDHVHLRVADLEASKAFYLAVVTALGRPQSLVEGPTFFHVDELFVDRADGPVSHVHLAFQAADRATVDAFHRAALGAGGRDNGAPGEREYHPGYYGAFAFDPDGNNIEAVCHGPAHRSADSVVVTPAGDRIGRNTQPIEVRTERLHLRAWRDDDVEPFATLNADPRVMAHFPSTHSHEASVASAARIRARMDDRGWGLWAAELRRTGEFIGFIGLEVPAPTLPCWPCVEVGWRLAAAHWGQGYATEGAKAALGIGFEQIGLDEIVSMTAVGNRRSRAVMERIGMTETDPTFDHPNVPVGSAVRRHCLYRLTRARWLAMAPDARVDRNA